MNKLIDHLCNSQGRNILIKARDIARDSPNYSEGKISLDYVLATYIAKLEERIDALEKRNREMDYSLCKSVLRKTE